MTTLVNISIDGKKIQAPEGANLLQVARDHSIDIPGLCYHKKLSPTGACRLCVTKISGQNGLIMSCTVQIKEGMEVIAFDEEIEETRRHTLDYLLAEHNDVYDGTYHDELRDLAIRYGLLDQSKRKYPSIYKGITARIDDSSPVLTYDSTKCIKCFRCIKACEEVQGKSVLSMSERGITSYVIAGYDIWSESECDGCGECVQLCPTGALVEKPHRSKVNVEKLDNRVRSTCPYCGVGCQTDLWVMDNTIVRSNGYEGFSPNDGRLCVKGRFGYEFAQSKERLKKPFIKHNGKFLESSWDDAIELVAGKFTEILQKYGPDSMAGYSSAKCTNEDNYLFQKFFRTVIGTNNIDYCTRLCHASTVTAMLRSIGDGAASNSIEDFETTDCLLVIGNNIIDTHPISATYVKRGAARGMKIIEINPRYTPLVKYATIFLQPKLGTDVALLNGMIRYIISENLIDENFIKNRVEGGMESFYALKAMVEKYTVSYTEELTGVPADKFTEAARIYATSPTAMIATGMGMSQQVTGTYNVLTLINMMLITGQIGKERAGISPPRGQNNVQGATDVGASPILYPGYIPIANEENRRKVAEVWGVTFESLPAKNGLTTVEIMKEAFAGNIKALYIMGENPMISDPNLNHTDEALKRPEFIVAQDIFHTETTPYAHVILPATSFAEKNGTCVNSDRRVLRVRKALNPPGEARQDWEIISQIAKKMGKPMPHYRDESEIFLEIAKVTPMMAGINYRRLDDAGIQWPCISADDPGTSTLYLEKFSTPSGKAKLNPVDHVQQNEQTTAEHPYLLNSGRILYQYHTATMSRKCDSLNSFANEAFVLMHPDDAAKSGIKDGEMVRVFNSRGELTTKLTISDEVLEGELFMPWHYAEARVNNLTRDELDPYSKIAPFKLSAVGVEKMK
jgi:formate dehydrogenase alpha subunit